MGSKRSGGCDKLPVVIMERVLSFLPVPVLCRLRSVGTTWREFIGRPSFHDLCDASGPNYVYLLMWKDWHDQWDRWLGAIDPSFTDGTLRFLDMGARRWYSIPASELPKVRVRGNEVETQYMAVDDGLVCELTTSRGGRGNNFTLTFSDPVAKTRKRLPAPPRFYSTGFSDRALPHVVTIVDNAAGSYKVILLNTLCHKRPVVPALETELRVYVHESFTNEWREQRNLPNRVGGLWGFTTVTVHQTVYVSKSILCDDVFDQVSLLSYRPQEDTWAEVWRMSFTREVRDERLIVSDNRLFLIVWTLVHSRENPLLSNRECPSFESLFRTNQDYEETLFEVYEVLMAENGRAPVVQLTDVQLRQIFGSDDPCFEVACGFPCFDSNGMCDSIVLVSSYTGQIRRYYLATGSVDVLPPHPLLPTSEREPAPVDVHDDYPDKDTSRYWYDAKTTKLSLRNLLTQRRMTGTSTG